MEVIDSRDDKYDESILAETSMKEFAGKTEIQKFYSNKTILITGGSGFLGILLVEKLLRSCPDLKKIILILREKRGKSIETRIKEIFSDEVYVKMKKQNPYYWKKIQIMGGCCEEPKMGISDDQIRQIQLEVDIVFHSAATVRFDEHIRKAYDTNVGGTKNMLEIAKGIRNLKAFVYVSTLYSQSHLPHIEEKFYPAPFTDEEMSILLERLDDSTLSCLTPLILNNRFNTYTMTKSMAEEVVSRYKNDLPIAIFRPSIVTATVDDPLVCWSNNIYGATGVFLGSGMGFLRTLYCDPDCRAEIIPADRVTSALIAVPLHICKNLYNAIEVKPNIAPVYNYVTDQSRALTWGSLSHLASKFADEKKLFTDFMLWIHHLTLEKNYTLWVIQYFVYHLLPSPVFLCVERLLTKDRMLWKGYIKLFKYTHLYSFFMVREWQIDDANAKALHDSLSTEDKLVFNCKTDIDWNYYFFYMMRGLGTYVTKYNWNNEYKTRKRRKVIIVLDRIIIWFCRGLAFVLIFKFISILIMSFVKSK